MGNCIVPQAKAKAKAMRVLEYKPPIKVLSEFKSHAMISDSPAKKKKKVKFADEEEEVVGQQVRIKVVMSKQELKSMVMSGEGISLSDIVCHQINTSESLVDDDDDDEVFSKGWEPMLHSIPEIDYAA